MPQLQIETFITQYFWLVIFLFSFYYFIAAVFIPKLAEIFKTRKKLTALSDVSAEAVNPLLASSTSLLSNVFSVKVPAIQSATFDSVFSSANSKFFSNLK